MNSLIRKSCKTWINGFIKNLKVVKTDFNGFILVGEEKVVKRKYRNPKEYFKKEGIKIWIGYL